MKSTDLPSLARLTELFEVTPVTPSQYGKQSGLLRKISRGGRRSGSVAGSLQQHPKVKNRLDWRVRVDGKQFYVSRVIYFMVNGVDLGKIEVDHKDKNPLNNNAYNLRAATRSLQAQNQKMRSSNTTRGIGVTKCKKTKSWRAELMYEGKRLLRSRFTCKIAAAEAYNAKVVELGLNKLGKPLNDITKITCVCSNCMKTP